MAVARGILSVWVPSCHRVDKTHYGCSDAEGVLRSHRLAIQPLVFLTIVRQDRCPGHYWAGWQVRPDHFLFLGLRGEDWARPACARAVTCACWVCRMRRAKNASTGSRHACRMGLRELWPRDEVQIFGKRCSSLAKLPEVRWRS